MIKLLKMECRLLKGRLFGMAVIVGGTWLFGFALTCFFTAMVKEYIPVTMVTAGIGLFIAVLTGGGFQTPASRYSLAVSMGRTRRETVAGSLLSNNFLLLTGTALILLLWLLEYQLFLWLSGADLLGLQIVEIVLREVSPVTPVLIIAGIVVGANVLSLLMEAVMLKWGAKGQFLIFAPIWILCFLVSPITRMAEEAPESLVGQLGLWLLAVGAFLITPAGIALCAVVLLLFLAICMRYLLRAPVRL